MDTYLPTEVDLVQTARKFYSSGLSGAAVGVLAARHAAQDLIVITTATSDFKSLEAQDLCLVTPAGDFADNAVVKELPDSLNFYLKVFEDRADVVVLAHLFPPFTSVAAEQDQLIEFVDNHPHSPVGELLKVECRECPSRFTGLCSCRSEIRKSYAGADALLIKEDGIIVMAADLDTLFEKVAWLERVADKSLSSNSLNLA